MEIDYSVHLLGIVFSDIRLVILERHTYIHDINNMLPAYTKVNQAKLIFIFTSRRYAVLKYDVLG